MNVLFVFEVVGWLGNLLCVLEELNVMFVVVSCMMCWFEDYLGMVLFWCSGVGVVFSEDGWLLYDVISCVII